MQPIPNASDILQAVIDATPDAIFVKDLDGRYVLVNQAAARFVGRTPAEVVGKHDFELYPEETARQFIQDDQAVLAERRSRCRSKAWPPSASGTQAYLVTKGVYRDQATASILGIYGISHDITELRAAQDSLEQTRAGAVPLAEDGSGRPADRRHRARLQQHPDGDPRQPRAAADAAAARSTMRRRS